MEKYKEATVRTVQNTLIGITCDVCKKDIEVRSTHSSSAAKLTKRFYKVETNHSDLEDMTLFFDVCGNECLIEILEEFLSTDIEGKSIKIEQVYEVLPHIEDEIVL